MSARSANVEEMEHENNNTVDRVLTSNIRCRLCRFMRSTRRSKTGKGVDWSREVKPWPQVTCGEARLLVREEPADRTQLVINTVDANDRPLQLRQAAQPKTSDEGQVDLRQDRALATEKGMPAARPSNIQRG